jgi:hypothetical protein
MAAFNKFNAFVADVANKVHNLGADTLKIMLTDTAPAAGNAIKASISEIAAGNGYAAGGAAVTITSSAQAAGTYKLVGNSVTFTAAGGAIAQFRYAVLYNATPASGNLIGWWDYGAELNITSGHRRVGTTRLSSPGTRGAPMSCSWCTTRPMVARIVRPMASRPRAMMRLSQFRMPRSAGFKGYIDRAHSRGSSLRPRARHPARRRARACLPCCDGGVTRIVLEKELAPVWLPRADQDPSNR